MALRHIDVTLGAAATQLSTTRYGIRHLVIQNTAGNDALYIGGSTVSDSTYGHTLAASGILHIGPFSGDAPLNTDEVYFKGTENDVVHCIVITH